MDPKRSSRPGLPGPIPLRGSPAAGAGMKSPAAVSPAVQARRQPGPALGETFDQLSQDIRKLQIDFERYFNGGLPFPPEELRGRIQAQIRGLRNVTMTSAVDSFRLGDLEARFNSYNEMFNRRVRDREEGRLVGMRHAVAPEPPKYDPMAGIVFGTSVEPAAVEALYQGLASQSGGPRFDLDSFQTYLARQAAALREKTGCQEVQFRLASEDGKLKLKARPVPAKSAQQ